MPFYLREVDVIPEVSKFRSALIVLCRFCPAASFSLSLELFGVTPILHHKKEMEVSFTDPPRKADGVSAPGPFA